MNENQYKVAVGKYDRNISIKDNDFTQIIDVGNKFRNLKIYEEIIEMNLLIGWVNLYRKRLFWIFRVSC